MTVPVGIAGTPVVDLDRLDRDGEHEVVVAPELERHPLDVAHAHLAHCELAGDDGVVVPGAGEVGPVLAIELRPSTRGRSADVVVGRSVGGGVEQAGPVLPGPASDQAAVALELEGGRRLARQPDPPEWRSWARMPSELSAAPHLRRVGATRGRRREISARPRRGSGSPLRPVAILGRSRRSGRSEEEAMRAPNPW